jgi:hypothetical protein
LGWLGLTRDGWRDKGLLVFEGKHGAAFGGLSADAVVRYAEDAV